MIELNSKIKDALIKIDFIKRYEELSNKFNAERTPSGNRLVYIDGEEVLAIIQDLGYSPLFDAKEKFYKIKEEQIGKFALGVHIILQGGMVDLVWVVRENGELLLGAPWGTYSRRLIDSSYRIKKPIFGTYGDLEEILKITFEMYEDFKRALLMVTYSDLIVYNDLYCKIYLDTALEIEELYLLINELLSGELEPIRIIKTAWCEIDLRRNSEFDLNRLEENLEDFIFWKYYLDVEPAKADEKEYIKGISDLIIKLKGKGIKAVPSCDFEEAIQLV